jgi:phage gpG-like protein
MQARFTVSRDLLTPALRKKAAALSGSGRRALLEQMGLSLASIAQRAFNDASLRPSAWAPRRSGDGDRPLLKRSGLLWKSPRIAALDDRRVTVGSDRPYASAHQFGTGAYTIRPKSKRALFWPGARHPVKAVHHPGLPARPFFPFDTSGKITPTAAQKIRTAAMAKLKALLGA